MRYNISEVQVVPVKAQDGLVGFASFVIDNALYVGSVGIYSKPHGGYRLTYPTRKRPAGNLHLFHPINKPIAEEIQRAVINKFEEVTRMSEQ